MTDPDLLTYKAQAPKPLVSATPQFWDPPAATEPEFPRFLALQLLCNCPNISIRNSDCGALSKGLLLWSYSLRKCNPSKQQALGFTTTHQKSPEGFLGTLVRRLNPKYFWKKILGSKTVLSKSFLGSSWIYLVWSHYISIRLKIYILPYKDAYHIAFNFAISSYYPHFSSNL